MKKSWKVLGELMGNKKNRYESISLMDENVEIFDAHEVANKFADYFGNVGKNLDEALPNTSENPCSNIVRNYHSFYLFPVTPNELMKIISNLKLTSISTD